MEWGAAWRYSCHHPFIHHHQRLLLSLSAMLDVSIACFRWDQDMPPMFDMQARMYVHL